MQNPSSFLRPARQPARHPRSAFTLIELIVVIMIIVILAGLLMVGVQAAVGRARTAAVAVDIKNLEQGIKEFQSKFGVTEAPPSGLILFEKADDWADFSSGMNTQQNAALIRRLWPNFLKSNGKPDLNADGTVNGSDNQDINGDGDSTDVIRLNGAECLAFFLGGIMDSGSASGTFIPQGFSSNPVNPFFRPASGMNNWGTRIGPFVEMRPNRLTDSNSNFMPEYLDAFPSSSNPYQYFSAYGGRGYRLLGDDNSVGGTGVNSDEILSGNSLRSPYLQKDNQWPNPSAMPPIPAGNMPAGTAWSPKGYQIISAGADGQWGIGGEVSADGVRIYDTTDAYREVSVRNAEKDNITSFKGGQLN